MSELVIRKRAAAAEALQNVLGVAFGLNSSKFTLEEFRAAADKYVGAQNSYGLASVAEVMKSLR